MATVYIEARPKIRQKGSPIDDYVVKDRADHVLATFKTQREAIEWAKKNGHTAHVARVRHLNDERRLITGAQLKACAAASPSRRPGQSLSPCTG